MDTIKLPSGKVVGTGNIPATEDRLNLCAEYPESRLFEFDEAIELITQSNRLSRRKLFPWILDQEQTNQCNAFAATASFRKKRVLNGFNDVDLSPASLYIHICGGVDQGSTLPDGMEAAEKYGWALSSQVRKGSFKRSALSREAEETAQRRFRAVKTYQMPVESLEATWRSIICAILRDDPVILAVHVGGSFSRGVDSNGIVYYDNGKGNHAIHADDVKILGKPRSWLDLFVDHAGSWGFEFGDNGRGLLIPRHIEQTRTVHRSYAFQEVLVDPDGNYPSIGEIN